LAPRKTARLIVPLALTVALLAAVPAHAVQLGPEAPHSPNAESMSTAYWVMLAVTVVAIVVVNVALIGALVRFRARRQAQPAAITAGRGAIPRVVGALSVLAVAIFVFGVVITDDTRTIEPSGPDGLSALSARTAQVGVKGVSSQTVAAAKAATTSEEAPGDDPAIAPPEGAPLVVSAIAQQWLWRFEYPGGEPGRRTFSYGELVVPVDTAVLLEVTSTDVLHSWWVPSLGGQVQAVPGSVAQTWFKADEEGTYEGRSTIFDGTSYPAMRAQVRVVSASEYESHIEQLRSDLAEAQGTVQNEVSSAGTSAEAEAEEGSE
jgi:cytochrome c oxidase subunit II